MKVNHCWAVLNKLMNSSTHRFKTDHSNEGSQLLGCSNKLILFQIIHKNHQIFKCDATKVLRLWYLSSEGDLLKLSSCKLKVLRLITET